MKNLSLDFSHRTGMSNFLSMSQGPVGKITALQRIYLQVSFSDEEAKQIQVVPLGNGMFQHLPNPGFVGDKEFQVEDSDAEFLKAEIDGRQDVRIQDVVWIAIVKEQLAKTSEKRKK